MSTTHVSPAEPTAAPADAVFLGPDLPPTLAARRRTDDALWLPVSAELTEAVAPIANRDDLIVSAVTATRSGAKANFIMPTATVEVARSAFGTVDPATLRPSRPNDRYRYPAAFGSLVHEAAHAAHSTWVPADVTGRAQPAVIDAADLLDEARIEAAHLRHRPDDELWLRAAVTTIVWPELSAEGITSRRAAAQAAALVLARRDAGVLYTREVAPIREAVQAILGAHTLSQLEEIWRRVLVLADDDVAGILAAGEAWCRTVGTDTKPEGAPGGGTGSCAPGTGRASDGSEAPGDTAAERLAAAISEAGARINANVTASTSVIAAAAQAKAEAEIEAKTARIEAAKVFSRTHEGKRGTSRRSPVTGTRPPTAAERGAAAALAKALRAASVRDRSAIRTQAELPPGRLRMRGVMARDAQRAAGAMPTAKPFTTTMRRYTDRPPLRVGIAVDVSSSMTKVTEPLASAAWILTRAVTAADSASKTATVAFGDTVTAITRPGTAPAKVTEFRAICGTEEFTRAVGALDLKLGLSRPGAARLLVVVSDGVFRTDQTKAGRTQLKALTDTGCAVLWLTLGTARATRDIGGIRFLTLTDPTSAAAEIGEAALAALTAAR
ncbi:VWA domain-containing protein [Catenulispora pinisilvae]|uniref:VWA domain-containing protein n=1 Tax=Catenulispora pinisilvae TaxID=2705253 RepID=UPI00189260F0|nr:VWA domain-containing protein [Catenulispora pinisilvae]